MKVWIHVTWRAVEAAIAALKMLSIRQHLQKQRKSADASDSYAEEFKEALREAEKEQ